MNRIHLFLTRHIGTWDEICQDDRKRLRMNVISFTFVVTIILFVLSIRTGITLGWENTVSALLFGGVSFVLFLWQFFRPTYSLLIAWLFGVTSLVTMTYMLLSGGVMSSGFLWVYMFPIVGTMMVPLRQTLIYNGMVLFIIGLIHYSNLVPHYMAEVPDYVRLVLPISVLILTLTNYVAAYTRARTQAQLRHAAIELERFAFTDPLTRAYNRRALSAHFGSMDESAFGLSFAMMDLDFFKSVNDTYGHEAGDRVLCYLAEIVHGIVPPNATFYRWGGEEFLLVLKSSEQDGFLATLEEIRNTLEHSKIPVTDGDTLRVTISIGATCAKPEHTLTQCVAIADEQLYKAKESGRNRVCFAD